MLGAPRPPIHEQVIVITGASSGIGLATARMAAHRGASVVLVARSETKLQTVVDELRERGGEATYVVADVAEADQVERAAHIACERYGGIDTWFNNAATSILAPISEVDLDDARRLFDVNFFGYINGCRAALPALRRAESGLIVNMGSLLSDRTAPLQGMYAATKHAVKAYTDTLRMELEREDAGVAVTLIKPTSVNTPYALHGMNLLDVEPSLPAPIYDPEVVARAVVDVFERPRRDVYIGAASRVLSFVGMTLPRATDYVSNWFFVDAQLDGPSDDAPWEGTLHEPDDREEPQTHGKLEKHVCKSSLYTRARLHPARALAGLGIIAAGLWGSLRLARRSR
ncbi:MAG: SDR family oxidoreductase [Persicimonas sp.]